MSPPETDLKQRPPMRPGRCAAVAAILEATAPKPGNVYRGADFQDLTYPDFLLSALAIEDAMENAADAPLGSTVLQAITATRQVVTTNTNLGIVLLFAPLAKAAHRPNWRESVGTVLADITSEETAQFYEAIRLAQPGGMGTVPQGDVHNLPELSLLEAMQAAAGRDMIARQYTNDFADVFGQIVPDIESAVARNWALADVIVYVYLQIMARWPDSLIARKTSLQLAQQSSDRAAAVLQAGTPGESAYEEAVAELDFWLRTDGHRKNPGTSADLVAAGLLVALWQGTITFPVPFYRVQK